MQARMLRGKDPTGIAQYDAVRVRHQDLVDELLFLEAWEKGLFPLLSAFLRVRQIRRAWPGLTLQSMAATAKEAASRTHDAAGQGAEE